MGHGDQDYKPTSPGRRFATIPAFDEITKTEPEKALTAPVKRNGGRNNNGRITTRHQGGGHKRLYRIIDFKRDKDGVPAGREHRVRSQPQLPHRAAGLRRRRQALHPGAEQAGRGRHGRSRSRCRHPRGRCLPLRQSRSAPWCTTSSCKAGRAARSPDRPARPPRSWPRKATTPSCVCPRARSRVPDYCRATIGQIGNAEHENHPVGKAGRKRWMGVRPGFAARP